MRDLNEKFFYNPNSNDKILFGVDPAYSWGSATVFVLSWDGREILLQSDRAPVDTGDAEKSNKTNETND